ncbi:MAG: S8 family peptidase, partial [Bdellovibrionales bacterium]|nr:S8 family peptidase [Bdellovibrionales bacterium]
MRKLKGLLYFSFLVLMNVGCGQFKNSNSTKTNSKVSERYIVVFRENSISSFGVQKQSVEARAGVIQSLAAGIASSHGIEAPKHVYAYTIGGGAYDLSEGQAENLRSDPRVAYVEKDQVISIRNVQSNPEWGLDRLDQESLPLDKKFDYGDPGSPVNVYVIDTGIKFSHNEFGGRAKSGFDFVDNDSNAEDCEGHGSHVAGTIGGSTYGVAKSANLFAVRVLDCSGSGSFSGVIAGIDWVAKNHVKPAVANMSLGGGASQSIDDAVEAAVQAGVTFAVAAG